MTELFAFHPKVVSQCTPPPAVCKVSLVVILYLLLGTQEGKVKHPSFQDRFLHAVAKYCL